MVAWRAGGKAGWSYLCLRGQPVRLGAVREIYWVSREIHIQLRAQCWGYQTFQRGDGTSPALWTTCWTAHSESDIFPPAREPWPARGRKSQEANGERWRRGGRGEKWGKRAGKPWRKSNLTEQLSTQPVDSIITHSKRWPGQHRRARVNVCAQPSSKETLLRWVKLLQVPHTSHMHTHQNWHATERNHTHVKILSSRRSFSVGLRHAEGLLTLRNPLKKTKRTEMFPSVAQPAAQIHLKWIKLGWIYF